MPYINKEGKGITLIALIITIIVMLILATVTINMAMNGGLFGQAQKTGELTDIEHTKEQIQMAVIAVTMKKGKSLTEGEVNAILATYTSPSGIATIAGDKITFSSPLYTKKGNEFTLDDMTIFGVGSTGSSSETTMASLVDMSIEQDNEEKPIKVGDYVLYKPATVVLTNSSGIIEDLTDYSGNTSTAAYNKIDSINAITQELGLQWRVLDVKGGQVRLISAVPTTSIVRLEGAKGYNNAVKLLDEYCSTLYSKSGVGIAQSLKIEDIEEHLIPSALSTVHLSPYKTYPYPAYSTLNSKYPKIFEDEISQKVDSGIGSTYDLSNQGGYITEAAITTATAIQVYQTYWSKSMTSGDWNISKHHELFINNGSNYLAYWMSSRCVNTYSAYASSIARCVNGGLVDGGVLYISNGAAGNSAYRMRPVITLNANIQKTGGNGTSGWTIE